MTNNQMDWNRWAAEKVMGWPEKQIGYNWVWLTGGTYDRGDGYQILCNIHQGDWNPLHDKNHLWIVMEKMVDKGYEIIMTKPVGEKYQWEVSMGDDFVIRHDNLNLAVLEAAKKAMEG